MAWETLSSLQIDRLKQKFVGSASNTAEVWFEDVRIDADSVSVELWNENNLFMIHIQFVHHCCSCITRCIKGSSGSGECNFVLSFWISKAGNVRSMIERSLHLFSGEPGALLYYWLVYHGSTGWFMLCTSLQRKRVLQVPSSYVLLLVFLTHEKCVCNDQC